MTSVAMPIGTSPATIIEITSSGRNLIFDLTATLLTCGNEGIDPVAKRWRAQVLSPVA